MAKVNDKEVAVARVYADSMIRMAEASGEADSLLEELVALAELVRKEPALESFVTSPTIDSGMRAGSIERLFRGKTSDLLVDSLQVINRKLRLGLLIPIVEQYRLAHQRLRNLVDVRVTSAIPLTDDLRARVERFAGERTGKRPQLTTSVDPTLLGGIVIRIGDQKFDASVSARLAGIRDSLMERASKEIVGGKSYVTGAA